MGFFFEDSKDDSSKNCLHVAKLPTVPFILFKKEGKSLLVSRLPFFTVPMQTVISMRGKAFFSKIAKCALVFSTLSTGGVSLFGFILLVHTTGQRKSDNPVSIFQYW